MRSTARPQYVALTDILGAEDAFGDMDFKVAGTREFVTALQLDTKLDGIPAEVLAAALTQARDARLAILDVMAEAIDEPEEMSPTAPRIITHQDPGRQDRRGDRAQGQGHQPDPGRHRRLDLDRGRRHRSTSVPPTARRPRPRAPRSTRSPTRRCPRSASATSAPSSRRPTSAPSSRCCPGKDGLLHISKLRPLAGGKRVEAVEDVVSVGQKIQVQIAEIDDRGKLSLVPVVEDGEGDVRATTPTGR